MVKITKYQITLTQEWNKPNEFEAGDKGWYVCVAYGKMTIYHYNFPSTV